MTMLKFTIRLLLGMACFSLAAEAPAPGQTATNIGATNAPAAATPSPSAIAPGEIVAQAQAVANQLEENRTGLIHDPALQAIGEKLPDLTDRIEERSKKDRRLFAARPTLNSLQTSQAAWQSLSDKLASAQKDLSERVNELDTLLYQLGQMDDKWKATLDANKANAPPEIAPRIRQILALITETTKAVQADLSSLYAMQNRVAAQDIRTANGLASVGKAIGNARLDLFQQNHPPLWDPAALAPAGDGIVAQERISFDTQLAALNTYLADMVGAVVIHLLLLVFFIAGFYWTRNMIRARARDQPALQQTARVLDVPLATALLLALLATWFLYPEAPRLLWAVAGATALIPAVIVTRRLIDPGNFSILYATMIAYFVDQVRYVATPAGVLSRFLLIGELLAASLFLLTALRSKHLCDSSLESNRLKRFTRIYLHLAFLVLVFAGFANAFGLVDLSVLAGEGMLDSSYLAVVLYAAVRIVDALVIAALSIRPLTRLGMVRRHHDLLYNNIAMIIRWLAFALWISFALQWFAVRNPLWQETRDVLTTSYPWGSITFSLDRVLRFGITIWAAFLLSRLVRFILEEEVYPHLQLARGIPYASSTMVHYVIVVVGIFAALEASNIDLTQFSILAGAIGVGLGFGLQNILNNFVSGVILLFERPVKVGDIIQIDATTMGTVERIGIRASVIRLTNGSELIVPNGNLISNPVTNWTLSNCERLIEIPVNVTSKVDPQHVLNLLAEVGRAHSSVLKNPAPQALLTTFSGTALAFRLRAWIDSEEDWMKITSELSLAVNSALARENIALG